MKRRNLLSVLSIIVTAMFITVACEKEKVAGPIDEMLITAEDDAITEAAIEDVFSEVDQVLNTMDMLGYEIPAIKSGLEIFETCKVITVDQPEGSFWPRLITIDYGDGCTVGKRTRKGQIVISVTGPMWEEGSIRVVSLIDYYVNDYKVEGTRRVTNEGRWPEDHDYAGKRYFSVVLADAKVISPEGVELLKSVDKTRTFMEGEETKWDTRDDIWFIDGSATGVNRNGVAYSRTIISPLWKEKGCRFITKGTVLIEKVDKPDRTLDYGDGTCDNIATVTVEGQEPKQIKLNKW